jgi:hypothetical protein
MSEKRLRVVFARKLRVIIVSANNLRKSPVKFFFSNSFPCALGTEPYVAP